MCDIGVFFSYTAVRTSDFEFDSWHLGPAARRAGGAGGAAQAPAQERQVPGGRCGGASEATVH